MLSITVFLYFEIEVYRENWGLIRKLKIWKLIVNRSFCTMQDLWVLHMSQNHLRVFVKWLADRLNDLFLKALGWGSALIFIFSDPFEYILCIGSNR